MVNYQNGKIYQIVNTLNDKIYIGSTCNELRIRFKQHRARANQEKSQHMEFYSVLKNNKDSFKIILIEYYPCNSKLELEKREYEIMQIKIQELTREKIYNISLSKQGQGHSSFGRKHTEETKQKLSELNKGENHPQFGKPLSDETKLKLSQARKGVPKSEQHKQKMSERMQGENHPQFGKPVSDETKLKITLSTRGDKCAHFKRGSIYKSSKNTIIFKWFDYNENVEKKRHSKSFSINKYGAEEARKIATELQNQIYPLNDESSNQSLN